MTALPTSLVCFRGELEAAVRRDQAARRRERRRVAVRAALAGGVVAAVALGALAVFPGGRGGRDVEPASAARRAAAALAATPGSVVHVELLVTQRSSDGSLTSWREESWQQTSPPYDERRILTPQNGAPVETAIVDGSRERYDPQTDTVYVSPSGGTDPATLPGAAPQAATAEPFRAQILDLLRSHRLKLTGRSTVDGRRTLSFTWNDGHTRYDYTVAAGTYDPVRWQFSPDDAATPAATVVFDAYDLLPADQIPLDLSHYHPGATVESLRPH